MPFWLFEGGERGEGVHKRNFHNFNPRSGFGIWYNFSWTSRIARETCNIIVKYFKYPLTSSFYIKLLRSIKSHNIFFCLFYINFPFGFKIKKQSWESIRLEKMWWLMTNILIQSSSQWFMIPTKLEWEKNRLKISKMYFQSPDLFFQIWKTVWRSHLALNVKI